MVRTTAAVALLAILSTQWGAPCPMRAAGPSPTTVVAGIGAGHAHRHGASGHGAESSAGHGQNHERHHGQDCRLRMTCGVWASVRLPSAPPTGPDVTASDQPAARSIVRSTHPSLEPPPPRRI